MYVIKNSRIGAVGTEYKPKEGINVNALIWAGFIVETADETDGEVSTTPAKKGAKNKKATKED